MNPVNKYFLAEKFACSIGVAIGAISLVLALYFLFSVRKGLYTGMAWPFLIVGIFFLVICISIVIRTPKDIQRVETALSSNHSEIASVEIPRMQAVMRNFNVIIIVEVVCIAVAIFLLLRFAPGSKVQGVGVSLLVEAVALLIFDVLAKNRGQEYLDFLLNEGI